jgi:UDP-N-acetylmuramoyl-L-alanine---L-glutamate ligase
MRPTLSWSDLAGRKAGLYGLGREGRANLRKCIALGIDPPLVDDAPATDDLPVLATADGGLDALLTCEVVIKTPGISRYTSEAVRRLTEHGIPVVGGLGLWLQEADRSRVLCITGTKGKSSTAAIAGHLIAGLGRRCLVGGNIGAPPYDPVHAGPYDYWVIEVSSYQATDIAVSPSAVAVTSLHPDHLPWHRDDVETYYRDKLSLCSQPGAELTIANGDSDLLRERRDLLGPRVRWIHSGDEPDADWMAPLGLLGAHNRRNALIARAGLQALGVPGADDAGALHAAATGFVQLESRLRPVGIVDGVLFVDDSLATNVLPTLAAVAAFPDRPVAVIVGGLSRGIDYTPLAVGLRTRTAPTLVLTVPDNGAHIGEVVRRTGAGPYVETVDCDSLPEAVGRGFPWARPDGVVLLSPAAASFGRFTDYRARGDAFADAMRACTSPDDTAAD